MYAVLTNKFKWHVENYWYFLQWISLYDYRTQTFLSKLFQHYAPTHNALPLGPKVFDVLQERQWTEYNMKLLVFYKNISSKGLFYIISLL